MKIRTLDDGTLLLEERLTMVRWGAALGAVGLVAAYVVTHQVRGYVTGGEMLGGGIGFLALMGVSAAVVDRSFRFERGEGRLRWKAQRLFETQSGDVPFADVLRVSLLTSTDTEDPHRTPVHTPILVTRGRPLTLTSFYSRDPELGERLTRAIGQALGRTLVPAREATVEELLAADRVIDAVKQVRRHAVVRGGAPLGLAEAKSIVDGYRRPATAAQDDEQRHAA